MTLSFRERMAANAIGNYKNFRQHNLVLPDIEAEIREPLGRFYNTPDGWVPSITTILSINSKDHIAAWRKRVGDEEADRISKKASERGTRVHEICEHYIDGNRDKLTNLSHADLLTFKQIKPILDQNLDDILLQEAPLYSTRFRVAGRTDCIGSFRGKLSIVDFKTSTKQKRESWITNYFQQASAYSYMFEEMTGHIAEQCVIIIACDSGDPQVFIKHRDDYINEFIATRERFKEINGV